MTSHSTIVGRFAPSPSGRMHLGNMLCALLAWLSVRAQNGTFILRIEDLDTARCPRRHAVQVMDDLRWLGLDWDIGPDPAGVPCATDPAHYQSLRSDIYAAHLSQLQGCVYPCFCTRAALHAASAPHTSDGTPIYSGACYRMTPTEISAQTRTPALRLHVPDCTITVHDRLQPPLTVHLPTDCGDYIVRRSDGMFGYQLAVVVDDGLQGVTEVVRGRDLLSSTPWQMALFAQLGFAVPQFCHIPLLVDAQGRRLSKRDADLDMGALRAKYTADEIVGMLAHAVHLTDTNAPICVDALIERFSWDKIPQDIVIADNILIANR